MYSIERPQTHTYSVSELNLETKNLLESTFGRVRVKGELSNLSCPGSGHWYFTLKDHQAQVKCAMFKGANFKVNFKPTDGLEVFVLAKVSLYPDRGDYQLIVEQLEASGEGKLRQAFELLKNKLSQEGLFSLETKKQLPEFPTQIGIISSPTGAAIRDIISVLSRRYPAAQLYVYPCQVQGQAAAADIVEAIQLANTHHTCEVLILARGGGSLEDLWPFNEESVARAIFSSHLPIVSGVGHETDLTIADFVADYRAPTPSAAAETVSPDQSILTKQFINWETRLYQSIIRCIQFWSQKIDYLEKRLISPEQNLKNKNQQLDSMMQRLQWVIHTILQDKTNQFKQMAYTLGTVNPFATLGRGYSITHDHNTNAVLCSIQKIEPGDHLATRLQDGWVISEVIEKTLI